MIKATITYSADLVRFHRFEIAMSVLQRPLMREQGMQLQFQFLNQETGEVHITSKGLLVDYSPWSESPAALTLRALHTLYTDWSTSVPAGLRCGQVASMQIAITYAHVDQEMILTSASAIREPGTEATYAVQRSIDGTAPWPLQIPQEAAVPLGIALKLMALENSSQINFSTYPPALDVKVSNRRLGHAVAIADVPDYARVALLAYIAVPGSNVDDLQNWVPASRWYAFLGG